MKKIFLLTAALSAILILSACNAEKPPVPTASPTAAPQETENQATPTPTVTPTVTAVPTAEPTTEPTVVPTPIAEKKTDGDYSALNNDGSGWGFRKRKGAEPDIYQSTKDLFAKYNTYYMDQSKPKAMYLTFDEGYENGYTAKILDTLKKCNVKAAFFVTRPYLEKQTDLINRMISEGHTVGNHTVNHPNLPKLENSGKVSEELNALNKKCKELYGIEMKYMRPPEGEYSERVLAIADDLGYKTILWSFAYRDWETDSQKGADYAFEQVTPYFHDGAILLLHAVSSDNAAALESIINEAKSQGYEFRTLDELK